MPTMTRRLQILIDEDRYHLLDRESQRSGKPIAELIRDAVDDRYGTDDEKRRAAADRFLASEPVPVADWDVMKRELRDSLYGMAE
ncbi:MAG: ribbon-helix-helix protein, CopG family [Egibacteraceae bacterium]